MALDNNTLHKFAELVNAGNSTPDERTVYGTARVEKDVISVKIDGSETNEYIPMLSAVPFIRDGDRVVVTLKNDSFYISSVFRDKDLVAESLTLTGDSSINLNDVFKVDSKGNMAAKSGIFGDLHIEEYTVPEWDYTQGKYVPVKRMGVISGDANSDHLAIVNGSIYVKRKKTGEHITVLEISQNGSMETSYINAISVTGNTVRDMSGRLYHPVRRRLLVADDLVIPKNSSILREFTVEYPYYNYDAAPIGIVGVLCWNATNGGQASSYVFPHNWYINEMTTIASPGETRPKDNNGISIYLGLRNTHTTLDAKIKVYVDLLWLSDLQESFVDKYPH